MLQDTVLIESGLIFPGCERNNVRPQTAPVENRCSGVLDSSFTAGAVGTTATPQALNPTPPPTLRTESWASGTEHTMNLAPGPNEMAASFKFVRLSQQHWLVYVSPSVRSFYRRPPSPACNTRRIDPGV